MATGAERLTCADELVDFSIATSPPERFQPAMR
jgi:hypothetical protein